MNAIHFQAIFTVTSVCLLLAGNVSAGQLSDQGKTNYILQCQGCHRADGAGVNHSIPDLVNHGRDFMKTPEGRRYFVAVPGSAYSPLTDQELTDVVNYIVENIVFAGAEEGAETPSNLFTVSEVSDYRQTKMLDVAKRRREIIASFEN